MALVRFIGNLILATILVVLIAAILVASASLVLSHVWETDGLDAGVDEGRWAWIDEQPYYYRTWGPETGPWVVLLHGHHVEGMATWESNAAALARSGVRVLAIDMKGFGRSVRDTKPEYSVRGQAETVAKLLNQFHINEGTLVGHGWGCQVALQLAHDQPQFVGRLVLIAPQVYEPHMPLWAPIADVPYLGRAAAWAFDSGGPVWFIERERAFHDPDRWSAEQRATMNRPTHIVGTADALVAMAQSVADSDLPGAIRTTQVPTLVLLGRNDTSVSLDSAERLVQELPQGNLVILPDAGHNCHIEQASRVNSYLVEYAGLGAE